MELLDLAHAKGYTFTKAIMPRLTDPEGRRVVKDSGSSAFSYAEARRSGRHDEAFALPRATE
jgi:hypothetical protein